LVEGVGEADMGKLRQRTCNERELTLIKTEEISDEEKLAAPIQVEAKKHEMFSHIDHIET
jgi:hypothetical protein